MNRTAPIHADALSQVRLLCTTDLHMHLTSFDYGANRPDPSVGLTRTATLIAEARREARANGVLTLLLDNGDSMQGTPLDTLTSADDDGPHPLMQCFAHLDYDAIGLGNHDFDQGLPALETVLAQASCPVICTNLIPLGDLRIRGLKPHAILDREVVTDGGERRALRIGVMSFLPPQTLGWSAHLPETQFAIEDILVSARATVSVLKREGCDLVVALCHSGLGPAKPRPHQENAAIPLAGLPGIDAVIAGHTHGRMPGPDHHGLAHVDARRGLAHGTPTVMAGTAGAYLGVIDLRLAGDTTGAWQVADCRTALRPIARRRADGRAEALVPEDPALAALLAVPHDRAVRLLDRPFAHIGESLHSYFTFFGSDRSLATVAAAQAAAVRPFLGAGPGADLPLLSVASPGKYGARAGPDSFTDVPAGPLALRHLCDLYVFPNDLQAVIVTGAELSCWLETSASLFHRVRPGSEDSHLVNPEVPGHTFDVIFGLTYEIDLSRPAGRGRVRNIRHAGRPLEPEQRFVAALSSFRASGGGLFRTLRRTPRIDLPVMSVREALRRYLSGETPRDALDQTPRPWNFVPMPGTRVTVQTGPGATKHLKEIARSGVRSLGYDADGFLCLSIAL
ncbi:5'-nucleotidase C-terminal domain-containing protein [Albibacillus kandeliae]|uniref:5'-nucleotidase C-terminal domain-containing protein n=1 Tax=Albibacillus kandeliae TaxID=2174228 RepID=UPI000D69126A|nr:5'-nucleotidase C-terminal domain-containing protein [Albibacillus kandeliae]